MKQDIYTRITNQAYYSITNDRVQMPPFETFRDAEAKANRGTTSR